MDKYRFYAWRTPTGGGVYNNWKECKAACYGKPNERHKGFDNYDEACAFAYSKQPESIFKRCLHALFNFFRLGKK